MINYSLVGHREDPILDELTELIEKEFSLPSFEFEYDELWEKDTIGEVEITKMKGVCDENK